MKSKIKKFLDMPWASMLVENNKLQHNRELRSQNLASYIASSSSTGMVVDRAQCWDATPQGFEYWDRCQRRLSNMGY